MQVGIHMSGMQIDPTSSTIISRNGHYLLRQSRWEGFWGCIQTQLKESHDWLAVGIFLGRGVCHFHSEEFVLEFHLCRLGQGLGPLLLKSKFRGSAVSVKQPFLFTHVLWRSCIGIQWLVCNWLGKLPTVLCRLLIFSVYLKTTKDSKSPDHFHMTP